MNTPTDEDINNLIEIGKHDPSDVDRETLLTNPIADKPEINVIHPYEWQSILDSYSDDEIIYLFKGLVIAERELEWMGGSVASAIFIFREIKKRGLKETREMEEFAIKYCFNTYVPFGEIRFPFRRELVHAAARKEREREREERRKSPNYKRNIKRRDRELEIYRLRQLSREDRKKIREELLKKYEYLSQVERLEMIANDTIYPPEYYPNEWISQSVEEIQKLPNKLVKKLAFKLDRKTRGEYYKFKRKLEKYKNAHS